MITWVHIIWFAAGSLLGLAHASGIWRSTKHLTAMTAVMGMVRLAATGIGLALAAIFGGILPAASGWAIGFFVSVGMMLVARSRASDRRAAP